MPPFIPTTRRQPTPPAGPSSKRLSLFDAADEPGTSKKTLQDNKKFLEKFNAPDDDSSLSDMSSGESEMSLPPTPKRRKLNMEEDEEGDNDEEVDWEDAIEHHAVSSSAKPSAAGFADLELTLDENAQSIGSLTNPHDKKKGPSKIEREIRMSTHRMHVQFLLFHNLVRSRWAADKETQETLVAQLPEQIRAQVDKWRVDSNLDPDKRMSRPKQPMPKSRKGGKKTQHERDQRDWGKPAERQEKDEPNMSAGDPIIRLLKFLCAYWKKRFTIVAPGLRKEGYKSLAAIEQEISSMRKDKHDSEVHGERLDGIEAFRKAARDCEGSRDIGAQLFTALLRGLGIEARLVVSLQPLGFGWGKNEEAFTKKEKRSERAKKGDDEEIAVSDDESVDDAKFAKKSSTRPKAPTSNKFSKQDRNSKGAKDAPIDLSEGTSMSMSGSDDDESVVDVTPEVPKKKRNMNYDHDLPVPNCWTEVISPITYQVYPIDALILKIPIVTSPEYLSQFEPRGAKAEKAKQVFAYVLAYSADGTAKDVTTRYLKRHLWPGRTKGFRIPVEKIPVYTKKGKIKSHFVYDWFKTVLSGYARPHIKRTAVDDLEEENDLKPAKLEKQKANIREDTLQFYKTSSEFVLERHLRREEAIKPASKPVRTFIYGKGDSAKEEPVYRRQDVEVCRTGESWHKEGRAVKPGEQAMKMVPIRAVTLTRKREVEEAERDSGEKQKQGLYARNQTDWIIPPPIEDGRIPKNAYGNIDCFVPTMVPKGAVHIPLRKTVMICKKLGIDYAEAVTGFEFGNKMAVPVITGVVIAEQHEDLVLDQWEKDEKERKIKEEGKREKMALATWRKWLMGLRIIQRVREEYGGDAEAHMKEEMNPFTNQSKARTKKKVDSVPNGESKAQTPVDDDDKDEMGGGFTFDDGVEFEGGGFLPEGYDEEEVPQHNGDLVIETGNDTSGSSPRGLAALTKKGTVARSDIDIIPLVPGNVEEDPDSAPPLPKRTDKGKISEKAAPKVTDTVVQKPSTNRKKRKAVSSPDVIDEQPAPSVPTPGRSVPKRKAACKSEIAVKSQYFNHSSEDDDGDSSSHSAGFESKDIDVEKGPRKRRGRPPGSVGKSRRAARNM